MVVRLREAVPMKALPLPLPYGRGSDRSRRLELLPLWGWGTNTRDALTRTTYERAKGAPSIPIGMVGESPSNRWTIVNELMNMQFD